MDYAKLIDGDLVLAPRKLRSGDTVVYNPPGALLREQGYKPLRYTDAPAAEEGYCVVSGWMETETEITQTWTQELEGDLSDAEVLDILLGGESA